MNHSLRCRPTKSTPRCRRRRLAFWSRSSPAKVTRWKPDRAWRSSTSRATRRQRRYAHASDPRRHRHRRSRPRLQRSTSEPTRSVGPVICSSRDVPSGVVVSPVVRRILNDGGVEPSSLQGTGPGGRLLGATPSAPWLRVRPKRSFSTEQRSATHGSAHVRLQPGHATWFRRGRSGRGDLRGTRGAGRVTRDGEPISDEMVLHSRPFGRWRSSSS